MSSEDGDIRRDAKRDGSSPDTSKRDDEESKRTLLRPFVFFLAGVIAVIIAIHYKLDADPGAEDKSLATRSPLILDFLGSTSDMSIKVLVFLQQNKHSSSERIFLGATLPHNESGTVLVVSSVRPQDDEIFHRLTPFPDKDASEAAYLDPALYDKDYVAEVKFPNMAASDAYSFGLVGLGTFECGSITQTTRDSFYGHLPSIDNLNTAVPYYDPNEYVQADMDASGNVTSILIDPLSLFPPTPSKHNTAFYVDNVSATEILPGMASPFETEQVDYMNPNGDIDGTSYTWDSNGGLEPIFKLTNQDKVQAENDAAFRSGIFFGLAGAAVIALAQEIPESFGAETWQSLRNRRKRKGSSAGNLFSESHTA